MSAIQQAIIATSSGGASGVTIPFGYLNSSYARPGWNITDYHSGSSPGASGTVNYGTGLYAVPGIPVVGALRRTAFNGIWSNNSTYGNQHPELFDGSPAEILNDTKIVFAGDNVTENYALEWKGYWKPTVSGYWNWSCSADDVCRIYIGDAAANPQDNNHQTTSSFGLNPNSALVNADQWYPIRIRFQEWGGAETCLIWAGPAGSEMLGLNYWAYTGCLAYNGSSDGY